MKPVLCGGEILLDFLSKDVGKGLTDSMLFEKRPGGSIFNVAVGLRRLEVPASLLTKLGGDEFSQGLMSVITEEKINTECLIRDPGLKTTLAFVALNKEGKPEFRFYRDHAADTRVTASEVEHINPQDYALYILVPLRCSRSLHRMHIWSCWRSSMRRRSSRPLTPMSDPHSSATKRRSFRCSTGYAAWSISSR